MKWALATLVVLVLAGLGLKWVMDERARNAPGEPSVNVQSAWQAFREAPGHKKHVGQMELDCAACHTQVNGGADRPGPERCATCHAEQATLQHAAHGGANDDGGVVLSTCTDCHGFGPDPKQEVGDCLRCHAEPQGALEAVTVHAQDDCLGCHVPHQDRVQARRCGECHQVKVEHGKVHADTGGEPCTTCHDPHAEAEVASERCHNCHGEQGLLPVPATAPHADKGCAGCHSGHRFTRATVSPCTSCHEGVHPLPGKGHTRCTTCHDPHALTPSEGAIQSCMGCHEGVEPAHGEAGPTRCVDCHIPHRDQGKPQGTCLHCHALANTEADAHGGGVLCAQCHRPHQFDAEAVTSCDSCHGARLRSLARHPGHADCATCHDGLPHLAGQAPQQCTECHEEQQAAVPPGHADCAGCHEPHAQRKPGFECAACHTQQAAAAGPGHSTCSKCHDAHSGARPENVANCSSCHQARRLPGLHRVAQHQQCASCHSVHGETPLATRESCLSCHTEQRDHQPEATRCNGCHTFRGPGARRGVR